MNRSRTLACVMFLGGLCLSCDEHLPAYEDPRNLFVARLRTEHVYSSTGIYTNLYLTFVNRYDETLEDTAAFDGTVAMTLLRETSYRKTFRVTASNLHFARSYQSGNRVLRIDPGDSVVFLFRYTYTDDLGRSLPNDIFRFGVDPNCPSRMVAVGESFSVEGSSRLYTRTASTSAPTVLFQICYAMPYVRPALCMDMISPTSLCR